MQNAELVFRPVIAIKAERVAEEIGCGIEAANKLLSQPETKSVLQAAMEQAFQRCVGETLRPMVRMSLVQVAAPRVDCAVALPQLPNFVSRVS